MIMIMAKKIHFYFAFGHFCPSMSLMDNIRGALLTSLNIVTEERRRLEPDRDPLMAIYVISPQTPRLSEQIGPDTKPTEQMRRGFHPARAGTYFTFYYSKTFTSTTLLRVLGFTSTGYLSDFKRGGRREPSSIQWRPKKTN